MSASPSPKVDPVGAGAAGAPPVAVAVDVPHVGADALTASTVGNGLLAVLVRPAVGSVVGAGDIPGLGAHVIHTLTRLVAGTQTWRQSHEVVSQNS